MFRGGKREIEVHCWGGLGSQLFALALIYDLELRFPRRSFALILHSSGVTRRTQEISDFPFLPKIRLKDDFQTQGKLAKNLSARGILRRFVRVILLRLGFVADANESTGYLAIKPWVRQIRGHYSRREISPDFIRLLDSHLESQVGPGSVPPCAVSVHYRLGDLLHLTEKNPIVPVRLAAEISRVQASFPGITSLHSDSLKEAGVLLAPYGIKFTTCGSTSSSVEVLSCAKSADYFIGTSSKISYWVVLLRFFKRGAEGISMPETDKVNLEPLVGHSYFSEINYY